MSEGSQVFNVRRSCCLSLRNQMQAGLVFINPSPINYYLRTLLHNVGEDLEAEQGRHARVNWDAAYGSRWLMLLASLRHGSAATW